MDKDPAVCYVNSSGRQNGERQFRQRADPAFMHPDQCSSVHPGWDGCVCAFCRASPTRKGSFTGGPGLGRAGAGSSQVSIGPERGHGPESV